jgi:hypothetical protein
LAREAVGLAAADFDFRAEGQNHLKSLPIFENEALRGELFQTWMVLAMGSKKKRGRIHTWSEGEKSLLLEGFDEAAMLDENADFIALALAVESVTVYAVGGGEDVGGKARIAFPLEPGIAFL